MNEAAAHPDFPIFREGRMTPLKAKRVKVPVWFLTVNVNTSDRPAQAEGDSLQTLVRKAKGDVALSLIRVQP